MAGGSSQGSERRRRTEGCLIGLAVGDALGAPLEAASAREARVTVEHGLEMSGGAGWAPGEWTDDTAMAIALAESIAAHGLLDEDDVAARYIEWANGEAKGIGATTRSALTAAVGADDARSRARALYEQTGMTAGNGTVMRAAPIALACSSSAETTRAARQDASLTHADPAAGAASAALCAAIQAIFIGDDPLDAAAAEVNGHPQLTHALRSAREDNEPALAALAAGPEAATCWTTLAVGLFALETADSYAHGVLWAIGLGGDTDTNAAVAGALLGCRHGRASVPGEWLEPLWERERIERAAQGLVDRRV